MRENKMKDVQDSKNERKTRDVRKREEKMENILDRRNGKGRKRYQKERKREIEGIKKVRKREMICKVEKE